MKNLDQKIAELSNRKREVEKTLSKILDDLYEKLEPSFDVENIMGECCNCTSCLNSYQPEKAIVLGALAFTDGGPCYVPTVCIKVNWNWESDWVSIHKIGKVMTSSVHINRIIDSLKKIDNEIEAKIKVEKDYLERLGERIEKR